MHVWQICLDPLPPVLCTNLRCFCIPFLIYGYLGQMDATMLFVQCWRQHICTSRNNSDAQHSELPKQSRQGLWSVWSQSKLFQSLPDLFWSQAEHFSVTARARTNASHGVLKPSTDSISKTNMVGWINLEKRSRDICQANLFRTESVSRVSVCVQVCGRNNEATQPLYCHHLLVIRSQYSTK